MWQKIRALVELVARVCCLNGLVGDPVTIRFFLAHATRTFGPHEVIYYGDFQLPPNELDLASIRKTIMQIVDKKFPREFPVYSDLRIFKVRRCLLGFRTASYLRPLGDSRGRDLRTHSRKAIR